MKKAIIAILFIHIFCGVNVTSAKDLYYWYQGEKRTIEKSDKYLVLSKENTINEISTTKKNNNLSWRIQTEEQQNSNYIYQSPVYKYKGQDTYISNNIYVRLKTLSDSTILFELAKINKISISHTYQYDSLIYVLSCSKDSKGNALEIANTLYESARFDYAEPEFLLLDKYCAYDHYYADQWNLHNIQYLGVDINYCNARAISQGNNSIIIAVIDDGVDVWHPDLSISHNYNVEFEQVSYVTFGHHGTNCAGVINAATDNGYGIAGIAPICSLIGVAVQNNSSEKFAKGIRYAINAGASVILCAWGSSEASNSLLNNEIYRALRTGRNGLGTVVVCASGNHTNQNDPFQVIKYPATLCDSILVVGAIGSCGERISFYSCNKHHSWASCYGDKLDVVAPGYHIPTTTYTYYPDEYFTDYDYTYMDGTSAAAAHVAAIAGLVLSVNSGLTGREVNDIIERTAHKLSSYSFNSNHPNGTWCDKVGYGLANAYAAVYEAKTRHIQNITYPSNKTQVISGDTILAGYAVTNIIPYGNVIALSGSNTYFEAKNRIELRPGVRIESGATFKAIIGTAPSQAQSSPSNVRKKVVSGNNESANNEADKIQRQICTLGLSPNPVNTILHIQVQNDLLQAKIYTLNGQCVLQSSQTDIDVSSLPQGMYILRALTADGTSHQAKFIKE